MRFRFAPSPTGSLHLGNARTAVANWIEARRSDGVLVLRIEDTDRSRNRPGAEDRIREDLRWLGLDWDEGPDVGGPHGPYRQSERSGRYRQVVARLCAAGAAYPCSCDRAPALAGRSAGSVGACSCRPATATATEPVEGAAVRLRTPDRRIRFVDGLRGELAVEGVEIGDFVIRRADGTSTYQLAVVIDDHDMAIDHVIRGQDHLSNTPRQLLLYEALGWSPPRFTHLPLVLGADRARLSKRHGAVSVAEMRAAGVLPEALMNYLALLGWEPPEGEEVLAPTRLVACWRVEETSASNLVFDPDKLDWLNQRHLVELSPETALEIAEPFLVADGLRIPASGPERDWWREVLQLLLPSVHRLAELPVSLKPLLWPQPAPAGELRTPSVAALLDDLTAASRAGELTTPAAFRDTTRRLGAAHGLRGRELFHPIRVAVTGRESGPELARLVPLLERGAQLRLEPPVAGVAERLQRLTGQRP